MNINAECMLVASSDITIGKNGTLAYRTILTTNANPNSPYNALCKIYTPMLNPNLIYFIDKCRENNFSINILSNLTLLTDDMVSVFSKTPLLSVQTSLYSMDAAIHDSITTVKGSFVKTKHAIEVLREHNVPMQINCPIMKQNKDSYQSVLDWANALNIEANSDYMIFGCFDGLGGNLSCRLAPSEVEVLSKRTRSRRMS